MIDEPVGAEVLLCSDGTQFPFGKTYRVTGRAVPETDRRSGVEGLGALGGTCVRSIVTVNRIVERVRSVRVRTQACGDLRR